MASGMYTSVWLAHPSPGQGATTPYSCYHGLEISKKKKKEKKKKKKEWKKKRRKVKSRAVVTDQKKKAGLEKMHQEAKLHSNVRSTKIGTCGTPYACWFAHYNFLAPSLPCFSCSRTSEHSNHHPVSDLMKRQAVRNKVTTTSLAYGVQSTRLEGLVMMLECLLGGLASYLPQQWHKLALGLSEEGPVVSISGPEAKLLLSIVVGAAFQGFGADEGTSPKQQQHQIAIAVTRVTA
ncbi:hypothetical protein NOR_01925 [Metarhizium rileyi]|uniref:Uncharacterized protein n=1 Tax=Metarhizium rileyi (strain RCEF 4871) TaxID=1649241 RepID=A0A167I517_METRR|nr:hypothetical protein NOR_01925 [Metarhizium rileyi RCEF 4871]